MAKKGIWWLFWLYCLGTLAVDIKVCIGPCGPYHWSLSQFLFCIKKRLGVFLLSPPPPTWDACLCRITPSTLFIGTPMIYDFDLQLK